MNKLIAESKIKALLNANQSLVNTTDEEIAKQLRNKFQDTFRNLRMARNAVSRSRILKEKRAGAAVDRDVKGRSDGNGEPMLKKSRMDDKSATQSHAQSSSTFATDSSSKQQINRRGSSMQAAKSMLQSELNTGTTTPRRKQPSASKQLLNALNALNEPNPHQPEKKLFKVDKPSLTLDDMGGLGHTRKKIERMFEAIFKYTPTFASLGTDHPKGILIHGPPGSGKTMLARAIAGQWGVPLLEAAATELIGGASGDSEKHIRDLFDQAEALATQKGSIGGIVYIDAIDIIASKRETAQREMERRIVTQLSSCMDALRQSEQPIVVIGTTSRPDAIDKSIRRNERFSYEIALKVPDEEARKSILDIICSDVQLHPSISIEDLASRTPGFVGADLYALVSDAGLNAVFRLGTEGKALLRKSVDNESDDEDAMDEQSTSPLPFSKKELKEKLEAVQREEEHINADEEEDVQSRPQEKQMMEEAADVAVADSEVESGVNKDNDIALVGQDFDVALTRIKPSATREGFATIPNVKWEDVGALKTARKALNQAIAYPLKYPNVCKQVGIHKPPGVLLYGPPGCGKTLLAKALANSVNANFISVKGPELMNKYVGESEAAVRGVFTRAKTSSPCIIFFDELDSMCPKRGDSSSRVTERIVNQFLTELDGFDPVEEQIFVIGATNRKDIIDDALLRPGRMEKIVYVGLPNADDRVDILAKLATKVNIASNVDIEAIARNKRCEGYSGADVAALLREAGFASIDRAISSGNFDTALEITIDDLDIALNKTKPSVAKKDLARYGEE
eukprot:m.54917 g.54917  ORF g.54917 m.54917 type:complete len:796 (+) comp11102_c0_seq1:1028-3415(+)